MSKSPSLRRIQADIRELSIDPSDQYHAAPLESDMFVWHFTIRGAPETDFENGIYHGKILLSSEYPFKPPDIMFLTPNGRFETNTKLCLSFSAYHPELWQPAWGIRLILEALISFLPTKGDGAIGALDWTSEERKRLAKKSWEYNSPVYGNCKEFMDKWSERVKQSNSGEKKKSRFQKEIEQLHALQAATEGPDKKKKEEQEAKETGKEEDQQEDSGVDQNEEKKEEAMDQKPESSTAVAVQNEQNDSTKATNETTSNEKTMDDTKATNNTIENTNEPALMDDVKSNNDDTKETDETISNDDNEKSNDQENNLDDIKPAQSPTVESSTTSANTNTITENQPQEAIPESPLLSDPVVHAGIVIFSILVYLLVRKLQDVVSDLRDLEAQFHAS